MRRIGCVNATPDTNTPSNTAGFIATKVTRRFTIRAIMALFVAVIGIAAPISSEAQAQRKVTFSLSNKKTITVLHLDEVDTCAEAERIKAAIDRTRYRGNPRKVRDPRDRRLLRYEQIIAKRAFNLCPGQRHLPDRLQSFGGSRN